MPLVGACAGPPADPSSPAAPATLGTAPVVRQDLTAHDELAGWLGHQEAYSLVAGRDGIVTWMPDEGTVLGRGETAVEIDGRPTRLLVGDRPAWRTMAVGQPDGPDIGQLNANLTELGYANAEDLPDERFDWRTRDAVYRWEDDLGLRRTGVVELGDVLFLPAEIRVGTVQAEPGTRVGAGQVLGSAARPEQVVTVALDPARRGTLPEGSSVVVVLPDRSSTEGIVRSIGRVVSAPGDGDEPTVEVEIELLGSPSFAGTAFDAGPVVVTVERVLATDALVVPVTALLARAGQGYAVERLANGGTELVTVEAGMFAGGLVEVRGDLTEGDEVVVPS